MVDFSSHSQKGDTYIDKVYFISTIGYRDISLITQQSIKLEDIKRF